MSAAANLAGLFPPDEDDVWSKEMPNWMPIPIHTLPEHFDHIIATERPCPRYKKAFDDQLRSIESNSILNTMTDFVKLFKEKTGFKNVTVHELFFTWDTLYAQQHANLTLVLYNF